MRCQRRDTRNENNDPNCNRKQRRRQRQNFSVEFSKLKVTQRKTADTAPPLPPFFIIKLHPLVSEYLKQREVKKRRKKKKEERIPEEGKNIERKMLLKKY